MKYVVLNIWDFIRFIILDLYSLIVYFKIFNFGNFYFKNEKTGYRVVSRNSYCSSGSIFYKTKWDAFFGRNKYVSRSGTIGYYKI